MKVLNIHSRTIAQPKERILELISTLATKEDKVWPQEKWPPMRFKNGVVIGSKGGHGPIRYSIKDKKQDGTIVFQFYNPKGFNGIHKFEISSIDAQTTEITHTIDMETAGTGTLKWIIGVKALHDALAEDALDKVENHFSQNKKQTEWSVCVKFLRKMLA
ncbi:MAG: hypothetical protein ACI9XO_000352 [Paraglaciecola sp.]|jgi:hypothetical protein